MSDDATPDAGAEKPAAGLVTNELLRRAKSGDEAALARLMERYLPRLQRWASGRLPVYARSLLDTTDLVQETLLHALHGLERIEVRGPGGFQAYVRAAVLNRIKDQVRWAARRRGSEPVSTDLPDPAASPLEHAIGADTLERYERAMERLTPEERELIHLRIELDFGFAEVAAMTGRPSADAARMAVRRALDRLAEGMTHER